MERKAEGNPPSPEPARHGGLIYALPPPTLELEEGKAVPVTMVEEDFADVHPYDLGMSRITRPTPQEVAELNAVFKMKMYARPKRTGDRRTKTYRDAKCGDSEPARAETRKVEEEKKEEEKSEDKDESEEEEEEKDEIEDKDESEEDEEKEDKSSEMDADEMIADLESSEKSLRGGLFNEEQVAWAKLMKGSTAWRKKLNMLLRKWLPTQETSQRAGVVAEADAALQKLQGQITAALKQARKKDEKRQAEARKAEQKRNKAAREALGEEETEGRAGVTELEGKAAAKLAKQLVAAEKKLKKQQSAATRKRETAAEAAREAFEADEDEQRDIVEDEAVSARRKIVVSFRKALLKVASTEWLHAHAKGKKEVETAEAAARVKAQKQITASMKQARKAEEKHQAEMQKAEEKRAAMAKKAAREELTKEEAGGRSSIAELEGKAAAKIAKQLATAERKLQKKQVEKETSRKEALIGKENAGRCGVTKEEQKEIRVVAHDFTLGAESKVRVELELDEAAAREELAEHAPAAARLSQLAELLDLIKADVDLQERCEEVFKYAEPPPAPLQPVGSVSRNRLSVGIDSPERQPRSSVLGAQPRHRPSSARTRPGEPLDSVTSAKRSRLSTTRPERTMGDMGAPLSNRPPRRSEGQLGQLPRRSEGQFRAPPPSPLSQVSARGRGHLRASSAAGREVAEGEPRLSTASAAISRRMSHSAPATASELRSVTRITRQRLQVRAASSGDEGMAEAPSGSQGAPVPPGRDSRRSVPQLRKEPRLSAVSWQQRRRLQVASTLSDNDSAPSEPRNSAGPVRRDSRSRRNSSVGRASVGRDSRGPSQRAKELDSVVPTLRPRLRYDEAKEDSAADEDVEMPTQGSLFEPAASARGSEGASESQPASPREEMKDPKLGEFLSLPEDPTRESEGEEEKPLQGALVGQAPPPKRRRSLYKQPEAPIAKEQRRPSVNLPRGARSAFHFFCDARMPALMKQNRDRSYSQLRQWLRDSWDVLPEGERAEFEHKQACSVATSLQKPAPPTPEILSQARPSVEAKTEQTNLSPFSKLMAEERRKAEQAEREPSAKQPRNSILRRSEGRSQGRQEEEKKEKEKEKKEVKDGRRSRSRVRWAEDVHVHRGRDSGGSYDEPMAQE